MILEAKLKLRKFFGGHKSIHSQWTKTIACESFDSEFTLYTKQLYDFLCYTLADLEFKGVEFTTDVILKELPEYFPNPKLKVPFLGTYADPAYRFYLPLKKLWLDLQKNDLNKTKIEQILEQSRKEIDNLLTKFLDDQKDTKIFAKSLVKLLKSCMKLVDEGRFTEAKMNYFFELPLSVVNDVRAVYEGDKLDEIEDSYLVLKNLWDEINNEELAKFNEDKIDMEQILESKFEEILKTQKERLESLVKKL